jgi:hypothetical protein
MSDHTQAIVQEAPNGALKTNEVYYIYKQDAPNGAKASYKAVELCYLHQACINETDG